MSRKSDLCKGIMGSKGMQKQNAFELRRGVPKVCTHGEGDKKISAWTAKYVQHTSNTYIA